MPKKNFIEIIFKNRTLFADFSLNTVFIHDNRGTKRIKFNFNRNDVYVSEIKYALNCAKNGQKFLKKYTLQNSFLSHTLAIDLVRKYYDENKKN